MPRISGAMYSRLIQPMLCRAKRFVSRSMRPANASPRSACTTAVYGASAACRMASAT